MKIFIGADHRGYELKEEMKKLLTSQGHEVTDVGTHQKEPPCDYPQASFDVASAVAKTEGARGILICMTGIGHTIAANKVPGAYAALCYNKEAAVLSRQHNDANVLVLGAQFVSSGDMTEMIGLWLKTGFEGGRHQRRVQQIKDFERTMKA